MLFKKILIIGILFLFLVTCIIPSVAIHNIKNESFPINSGIILYVGGTGEGNYTKIQDAIDDASDGDTIFVFKGTYYEDVEVYKSINLFGEDKNTTEIIHYWDNPYVITITADFVNISGFTINCYWFDRYYWGSILVESCNNNISENIIKGDWYEETGIEISDNSNNNTIINNNISNNLVGLDIQTSKNNTIMGNIFSSNYYLGMETYQSSNNIIKDNIFIKNEHDLSIHKSYNNTIIMNNFLETQCCTCLDIRQSNNNKFIFNNITQNGWGYCIVLVDNSFNNIIYDNTISNGSDGIRIWYSSNYNTIINNNIISNEYGIYINEFSSNNSIYHNNFLNNLKKAYDECNNSWDNNYPSGGNYWDDYNGTDADGDGIGDTPYNISGGDNQDRYPLMEPLGDNLFPIADFTWAPSHPDPEEPIFFNASQSIDYDGNIILYEWDWDNDGVFNENHTSPTATHTFDEVGYYPVTLRVTDNDNLTDSKTKTVRVGNQLPVAVDDYVCVLENTEDNIIDVLANDYDPDGDSLKIELVTDPPNGTVLNHGDYVIYTPNPDFCGLDEFYYTINDGHDGKASANVSITVYGDNSPPDPPIIDGPSSGKSGRWICFIIHSTDPDGDDVRYIMDWGDGTVNVTDYYPQCEPVEVCHKYMKGTYILRAKVKDINGEESEWSEPFEIEIPRTRTKTYLRYEWQLERFPLLERLLNLLR